MPASGDAASTTQAAVAQGTIEIKDQANQKADITQLSRDTEKALNKLDEIFDKKTVQENQELSKMFGEEAFKLVGDLAAEQHKKAAEDAAKAAPDSAAKAEAEARMRDWDEGGVYKVALHLAVGGIMSDFGGSSFASGAIGAGFNEILQGQLTKIKDPALHQEVSWGRGY